MGTPVFTVKYLMDNFYEHFGVPNSKLERIVSPFFCPKVKQLFKLVIQKIDVILNLVFNIYYTWININDLLKC